MTDSMSRVPVITGAARGQGRSHAVVLAEQGVDIIAVDRCADIETIPYPLATEADLAETADQVRAVGGRIETVVADVRELDALQAGIDRGGDGSAATFAYAASKHGVVGLMRSAANAYAQHHIRVNSIHPTGVATPMIFNEHMASVVAANPEGSAMSGNLLPVPYVEAEDVTAAVLFLVSDGARYITGTTLPVDAGHAVM